MWFDKCVALTKVPVPAAGYSPRCSLWLHTYGSAGGAHCTPQFNCKELWGGENTAIVLKLIIQTNRNKKAFLLTPLNYHSHLQRLETSPNTKIKKGLAYPFDK